MGWISAGSLQPGWLVSLSGGYGVVASSIRHAYPDGITVYNFEVAGAHTYFVEDGYGEQTAVWVHNTCPHWRPVGARIKDYVRVPSRWNKVRDETVPSTNIKNKGGTSRQELFVNAETGEELVRHTLYRADGSVFEPPHFRGEWK